MSTLGKALQIVGVFLIGFSGFGFAERQYPLALALGVLIAILGLSIRVNALELQAKEHVDTPVHKD